jgi:septal ring factor EnvC (AmiA/AmiB activator)
MQLTIEMIVSIGALIASVGTSFIVVRQKVSELEETLKDAVRRLIELDARLDKNDNQTDLVGQKLSVIAGMMDPDNRERLHRSLERLVVEAETLRRDVNTLQHMHNGRHPPILDEKPD